MAIIFNAELKSREFYSNELSTQHLSSPELIETNELFNFQHGQMQFRNWYFDGYRLANNRISTSDADFSYHIRNDIDTIKFYFNRTGSVHASYSELSRQYDIYGHSYNILYSSDLSSRMHHEKGVSEVFSLQLTKNRFISLIQGTSLLRNMLNSIEADQPFIFYDNWQKVKPEMDRCINDILHCGYINDLKKLYLQSKANELFALLLNDKQDGQVRTYLKKPGDIHTIQSIKEYLKEHYATSITIDYICRHFAINEYKLKVGFKELFGTTVMDFLISERLQQARRLLETNNFSIAEIAYEAGYSSPNYFSKSFKKKYGINPSEF